MSKRLVIVHLGLLAALAGASAWAAAPTATPAASAAMPATAHPMHKAAHAASAAATFHRQVVLARAAEQRRWIHAGLSHHRLDRDQARTLQASVREVVGEQTAFTRRGHESVDEALGISHRQDVLDWAIRTGHAGFEPGSLHALG